MIKANMPKETSKFPYRLWEYKVLDHLNLSLVHFKYFA